MIITNNYRHAQKFSEEIDSSALYHKGARISVIFTFVGASVIVSIPMTLFAASFLGLEFTAIRCIVSIPLVILFSILFDFLRYCL